MRIAAAASRDCGRLNHFMPRACSVFSHESPTFCGWEGCHFLPPLDGVSLSRVSFWICETGNLLNPPIMDIALYERNIRRNIRRLDSYVRQHDVFEIMSRRYVYYLWRELSVDRDCVWVDRTITSMDNCLAFHILIKINTGRNSFIMSTQYF